MFLPWRISGETQRIVIQYAVGYGGVAILLLVWGYILRLEGVQPIVDSPAGEYGAGKQHPGEREA